MRISYELLCILFTATNARMISREINGVTVLLNEYSRELVIPISIIADQDKRSKHKKLYSSVLVSGTFRLSGNRKSAVIDWTGSRNYTSGLNNGGRGMELSDLKLYGANLLSVDDKTGIIYKLGANSAIPWVMLTEGDGEQEKLNSAMKGEWITTKGGFLYVGSIGMEMLSEDGEYMNDNSMYVKKIYPNGRVVSEDWRKRYVDLRAALSIHFPGYIYHEAVQWSDYHQKWFLLPRHMSKAFYDKDTATQQGSNVLISTSDCFCNTTFIDIGHANPLRGFSSFQFVPGTQDQLILAVKTQELDDTPLASFITLFNINGDVILEDTVIPGDYKFEGIEFVDANKLPDKKREDRLK